MGKLLLQILCLTIMTSQAFAYRINRDKTTEELSTMGTLETLEIGTPWNNKTAFDLYSETLGATKVYNLDMVDIALTGSMLFRTSTAPLLLAQHYLIDPLPKDTRLKIRANCMSRYQRNPWLLLICVNQHVTLKVSELMASEDRLGFLTACRAISSTVSLIYNSYNIPGARVSVTNFFMKIDNKPYGHAINTVTFTSKTGAYYGYSFDAGAYPGRFFPNTPYTINYHKKNPDIFPTDIGRKPEFSFRPAD